MAKETRIEVKLLPLAGGIEESENMINAKIDELRKAGYFINACTVSEGVAVLLVGKSS